MVRLKLALLLLFNYVLSAQVGEYFLCQYQFNEQGGACISQNLPLPGYNNRYHLIVYNLTINDDKFADFVGGNTLLNGTWQIYIPLLGYISVTPNDVSVLNLFSANAEIRETRPQRVTIRHLSPSIVEILFEEPTQDFDALTSIIGQQWQLDHNADFARLWHKSYR